MLGNISCETRQATSVQVAQRLQERHEKRCEGDAPSKRGVLGSLSYMRGCLPTPQLTPESNGNAEHAGGL
jgi:hypothetical protein